VLVGCSLVSGNARALNCPDAKSWAISPSIIGNWGGESTRLANLFLTFNIVSVTDFLANQRGGEADWSRVRGNGDFDLIKAELAPGHAVRLLEVASALE
jgi:hypothetical protein